MCARSCFCCLWMNKCTLTARDGIFVHPRAELMVLVRSFFGLSLLCFPPPYFRAPTGRGSPCAYQPWVACAFRPCLFPPCAFRPWGGERLLASPVSFLCAFKPKKKRAPSGLASSPPCAPQGPRRSVRLAATLAALLRLLTLRWCAPYGRTGLTSYVNQLPPTGTTSVSRS